MTRLLPSLMPVLAALAVGGCANSRLAPVGATMAHGIGAVAHYLSATIGSVTASVTTFPPSASVRIDNRPVTGSNSVP